VSSRWTAAGHEAGILRRGAGPAKTASATPPPRDRHAKTRPPPAPRGTQGFEMVSSASRSTRGWPLLPRTTTLMV
jgi:hypothetical protein